MPKFAYFFGIKPWEVCDLTEGELADFNAAIDQLSKA